MSPGTHLVHPDRCRRSRGKRETPSNHAGSTRAAKAVSAASPSRRANCSSSSTDPTSEATTSYVKERLKVLTALLRDTRAARIEAPGDWSSLTFIKADLRANCSRSV